MATASTMLRRMFTGRHWRMWLVALSCLCACVLLVWDRQLPSSEEASKLFQAAESETVQDKHMHVRGKLKKGLSPTNETLVSREIEQKINPCTGSPWQAVESVPSFFSSPVVSLKHSLLYCPVGKVGSSYFTRMMILLGLPRPPHAPLASPFTIPITQAERGRTTSLDKIGSPERTLAFLRKSELMVFGRDPYRRIFSAWIDKMYSPNPFYWGHWGLKAVRSRRRSRCEPNITFAQFVSLVVRKNGLHESDVHLRPVAEECRMCDLHYTLIGKIETASKDLDLLASRINVSMAFLHESDYREAGAVDTVIDAVQGAYSWRDQIEACGVSLDRMGRSIWRKLQIRGVFDAAQQYPFTPGELRDITAEKYIDACKIAIKNSTDRERLKRQKEVAFAQAYTQVVPTDLDKIAQVYNKDFLIFGYDRRPDVLFSNSSETYIKSAKENLGTTTTYALDWNKNWIL